jgi:hypothetical protein
MDAAQVRWSYRISISQVGHMDPTSEMYLQSSHLLLSEEKPYPRSPNQGKLLPHHLLGTNN